MGTRTYTRAVRGAKLLDELTAAVPACAPVLGADGLLHAVVELATTATACRITVPDTVDLASVDAVVAAHDPSTPSPAEQQATQDATTLEDWKAQYQALKNGLVTIRTHMDAIQAQADPTVANLASLVATVHVVKQIAGDVETMTQGLDRLLDALAILVRRAHGEAS